MYYIEKDGIPVPATAEEWSVMFDSFQARVVAKDHEGGMEISTVFTGMNLSLMPNPNDKPIVYETMVFTKHGDGIEPFHEDWPSRYSTREEAWRWHMRWVRFFQRLRNEDDE